MTEATEETGDVVQARLEFAQNKDGGIGFTLHVVPDPLNPAVHFAQWLYDNREGLSILAKRDYDAKVDEAGKVIASARPALRGPNGERL